MKNLHSIIGVVNFTIIWRTIQANEMKCEWVEWAMQRREQLVSVPPNMCSSAVFGMVIWTRRVYIVRWWMQNYSILLLAKEAKLVVNGSKKMNFKSNYKLNEIAIKLRTDSDRNSKQIESDREKNIKANEIEQNSKSRSYCEMTIIRCFHSTQPFIRSVQNESRCCSTTFQLSDWARARLTSGVPTFLIRDDWGRRLWFVFFASSSSFFLLRLNVCSLHSLSA